MKIFLTILEWAVGYLGVGLTAFTLLVAMFTDSLSFMDKFTAF